jgi:hypothetical protein
MALAVVALVTALLSAGVGPPHAESGQRSFEPRSTPSRIAGGAVACDVSIHDIGSDHASTVAIRVRILNEVPVEPDVLAAALKRLDAVFNRSGISVRWIDEKPQISDDMPLFDLVIVKQSPPLSPTATQIDGVLGAANRLGSRAHAYYNAIRNAAVAFHTAKEHLLADVIAHELGHLLLPVSGHSEWGVMRRDILRNGLARSFSQRETDLIAQQIRADAVGRRPAGLDVSAPRFAAVGGRFGYHSCRAAVVARWRCPAIDGQPPPLADLANVRSCR